MPDLLVFALIFFVSLVALIVASDLLTNAAEKIGLALGFSPFIVGVTIVAVGTSLPELISSIFAVLGESSEIVVSNVSGSNIANIFLIVGTAAIVGTRQRGTIQIVYDLVSIDLPLFVGSAFLFCLAIRDREFSAGEGLLFFVAYLVYLFYTVSSSEEDSEETPAEGNAVVEAKLEEVPEPEKLSAADWAKQVILLILGGILVYLGAKYTIDSLIKLSELLNIGKEIVAVSAVALGTSLPELTVTISSALKGKAEVAIGNVIGSNVFNIFVVTSIPRAFGTLTVPETILEGAVPTLLAGTLLLFFVTQDKKLSVWEGWLFYLVYAWFVGTTFNLL